MSSSHKIKRQVLDVTVSENKNVFQLQSQVRDAYYDELLPIIESELNKIVSGDELIVIDKLELNLGTVKLGNDMANILRERLTEKIKENLEPIQAIRSLGDKEGTYRASQSKTIVEWKEEAPNTSRLEALRSFLLNGYLPWSVSKDFGSSKEGSLSRVIHEAMQSSLESLSIFIQQNSEQGRFQQRVFHHFTHEQILLLFVARFEIDLALTQRELVELIQDAVRTISGSTQHRLDAKSEKAIVWTLFVVLSKLTQGSTRKVQFLPLLFRTIVQQTGAELPGIPQLIFQVIQSDNGTPLKQYFLKLGLNISQLEKDFETLMEIELQKKSKQQVNEKTMLSAWYSLRKNVFELSDLLPVKGNAWFQEWEDIVHQRRKELNSENSTTELKEKLDFSEKSLSEVPSEEDGIWVNNAGLVLLTYFLPYLFEHLGWLDEEQQFHDGAIEKALSMMNYLITNDEFIDESELTLCKLMLGLETDELITNDYRLSEEEKIAGDDLLQNVIKRWDVIKNTSIDGLRVSFLQREGIIYERDGHYLLRVERKTMDILMDQLPWSIGVIKLSWMPKIIMTEW